VVPFTADIGFVAFLLFKVDREESPSEAMIREGTMPSLETLLQAVADARQKYAELIKASRKRGGKLSKKKRSKRRSA